MNNGEHTGIELQPVPPASPEDEFFSLLDLITSLYQVCELQHRLFLQIEENEPVSLRMGSMAKAGQILQEAYDKIFPQEQVSDLIDVEFPESSQPNTAD